MTPLRVLNETFQYINLSKVRLYVPSGTSGKYGSAAVWKDFGSIQEYAYTDIGPTFSDDSQQDIYDISGNKQNELRRGLNIVNGKKIIVK